MAEFPISIKVGATFRHRFTLRRSNGTYVNLTGADGRMQIRETAEHETIILELTTANGRMIFGGENGTVDLVVMKANTATITAKGGVFDILIDWSPTDSSCHIEGPVEIRPAVTR